MRRTLGKQLGRSTARVVRPGCFAAAPTTKAGGAEPYSPPSLVGWGRSDPINHLSLRSVRPSASLVSASCQRDVTTNDALWLPTLTHRPSSQREDGPYRHQDEDHQRHSEPATEERQGTDDGQGQPWVPGHVVQATTVVALSPIESGCSMGRTGVSPFTRRRERLLVPPSPDERFVFRRGCSYRYPRNDGSTGVTLVLMVTDTTTTRPEPHPAKAVLAMRREPITVLAAAVHVNPNTLGRILNGHVSPWPQLRRRVAEHLQMDESELWRDSGAA